MRKPREKENYDALVLKSLPKTVILTLHILNECYALVQGRFLCLKLQKNNNQNKQRTVFKKRTVFLRTIVI